MINISTEMFFQAMLELFPQTQDQYNNIKKQYGRILETVTIEDIFVPWIIDTIEKEQNVELINALFDLFEQVSSCGDQHLQDVFMTTILECLGNDKSILCKAQNYMGPNTKHLQKEADKRLGRIQL